MTHLRVIMILDLKRESALAELVAHANMYMREAFDQSHRTTTTIRSTRSVRPRDTESLSHK